MSHTKDQYSNNVKHVSMCIDKSRIYEQYYDRMLNVAGFYYWDSKEFVSTGEIKLQDSTIIKPITTEDVLKAIVKLPTRPADYGSEHELIDEITAFIHRYVDIDSQHEKIVAYYVLLTWIYDKLSVCPYLSALGKSSSGKTRLIQTVGSICYKPILASGSISASSLFRMLDKFKGTLIINEFDHVGQFNSEMITILNNGFEKGMPVFRTNEDSIRDVKTYDVYGPKLFSTRRRKEDWAFESRLITIIMRQTTRSDIPPFLDSVFDQLAERIRNKLLAYRLKNFNNPLDIKLQKYTNIPGRIRQTLLAITSISNDSTFLNEVDKFAEQYENNLQRLKDHELDSVVLDILNDYFKHGRSLVSLQDVASILMRSHDFENIKVKEIGAILRDEFHLQTKRTGHKGNYHVVITRHDLDYLNEIYNKKLPSVNSEVQYAPSENHTTTELSELPEPVTKGGNLNDN